MFEFEARGGMKDLINLEKDLLNYLGFSKDLYNSDFVKNKNIQHKGDDFFEINYADLANIFETKELTAANEDQMGKEIAPVLFLENFPEYTSPFWNMKRNDDGITANKVDVILYGMETFGSAERETDANIMLNRFHTISNGKYSELLYAQFGRARVMQELGAFLDLPMSPRFGGGIGMTRFIRALDLVESGK
jgi:aspartyl/asparaginyl-tRNA synthetase